MYGELFRPLQISRRRTLAEVWKVPTKKPKKKALTHIVNTDEWKVKTIVGTAWPIELMKRNM